MNRNLRLIDKARHRTTISFLHSITRQSHLRFKNFTRCIKILKQATVFLLYKSAISQISRKGHFQEIWTAKMKKSLN